MDVIKTPLQHTIIKTNGVNLNVVQAGPEDGKLVILLHGFPEFWYGWRKQIDSLVERGYRVWVPDQRGYGLSDKPEGLDNYRIPVIATDVIGLIDAAGVETATVVGHDWGAAITWATALLYPERLDKIGILNVPHPKVYMESVRRDPIQIMRSAYFGFFQIPVLTEAFMSINAFAPMVNALKQTSNVGSFTKGDFEMYRKAWGRAGALTGMLNWYRAAVQRPQFSAKDWRIHVPTLMIWGAKDVALSLNLAQPSIDMCDDGQLHVIENATHWVQHDAAEQVNTLLGNFIG